MKQVRRKVDCWSSNGKRQSSVTPTRTKEVLQDYCNDSIQKDPATEQVSAKANRIRRTKTPTDTYSL